MASNDHEEYAHPLYFDRLPEAALFAILRKTSNRPRSWEWVAYLDGTTLLSMCEAGGALGDLARGSVSSIAMPSVHGTASFLDEHDTSSAYEYDARENEAMLNVDVTIASGQRNFKGLLQHLRRQLRMLNLSFTYFWARDIQFSSHCSNLETLVLYDRFTEFDLPAVLDSCSRQLRTLDLGAEFLPPRYIDAIATHCQGLRKLGLKFGEIGGPLQAMWETVGPSLVELCFAPPAPVSEHENPEHSFLKYEDIHSFCLVLETFEIRDIGFGKVPLSAIIGFGEQLKRLRMTTSRSFLRPEEFTTIFEACGEDIALEGLVDGQILHTLGSLASHLQVLHVNYDVVQFGLDGVGMAHTMLQELNVRAHEDNAEYFLANFLRGHKPYLRKLTVDVCGCAAIDEDHNIFFQVAELVDTVEKMSCVVYCISAGIFKAFADKNQNIKSVHITCRREKPGYDEPCSLDAALSFITDFSENSGIQELVLNDVLLRNRSARISATVRDLKLLGTSTDVFIGGIQYNP